MCGLGAFLHILLKKFDSELDHKRGGQQFILSLPQVEPNLSSDSLASSTLSGHLLIAQRNTHAAKVDNIHSG